MATFRKIDRLLYRHRDLNYGPPHYEMFRALGGGKHESIGFIRFHRDATSSDIPQTDVLSSGTVRIQLPISELPAIQHLVTNNEPLYLYSSVDAAPPGQSTPTKAFISTSLEEPGDLDF